VYNRPLSSSNGHGTEQVRAYADGELICREGESSTEMFVLRSGAVRIFKARPLGARSSQPPEIELAVLHKGDFFGEMSLLEGLPRDASAQAVGGAEVLVMTPGALLVRLRRDPTFAFELLRRLSGRVRSLNARLIAAMAAHEELRPSNAEALLYTTDSNSAGDQAADRNGALGGTGVESSAAEQAALKGASPGSA
jgi:CRP/FNR family transcriptional regulator, cyclic AMP receptor protein